MAPHLAFNLIIAFDLGITDHPQKVMKKNGINYQHATPQSLGDQWWFWNCKNLPNSLPEYLKIIDLDPFEMVGFGLSEAEAQKINDYIEPIQIGTIENYNGGLFIMQKSDKFYWLIYNYNTVFQDIEEWTEIDKKLFDSLIAYEKRRKK